MKKHAFDEAAAVELLKRVVDIPSVNGESNEKPMADFIAGFLSNTPCRTEVNEFAPGRANVLSVLKGLNPGKALLINGHLDTVPYGCPEDWDTPPDKAMLMGGRLTGRGASDMKSGLCAMLYAFRLLAQEGFLPQHDIIFAGTADEESLGSGASALIENDFWPDVSAVVIGEPTGNQIAVASKGALWLEVTLTGKTAHSAYPSEGINAAEIACAWFSSFKELAEQGEHPFLTPPTCTLTLISGGIKANMIPGNCTFIVDIRTVPPACHPKLRAEADRLSQSFMERYPGLGIRHKVLTDRMPVETSPQDALVERLRESIFSVCKNAPCLIGTGYFSDASLFLKKQTVPVVLFGPGDPRQAHKANEWVLLDDYLDSIACYINFLKKY